MKKPYPKNGDEQDIIYARKLHFFSQRPGVAKKVKRQLNKRFRKQGKIKIIRNTILKNYKNLK